jgi:hypothetical protein
MSESKESQEPSAVGSNLSARLGAVYYPKAFLYLTHMEAACVECNLAKPVGVILADEDFDEFRKWAVRFISVEKCMLESGNLVLWSGMEVRRQHPLFPPDE